ncbi:MAG TPA: tetratricopeptide repeat protein [Bacteroidales bacterium]|nr:tetratricopeptide repeat protein [Bacteroidales bacterium]
MNRFIISIALFSLIRIVAFSQNCDSLYIQSLKIFDASNIKESAVVIESCITQCPAQTKYYMHAAKCYYQLKHYDKTLKNLQLALASDSMHVPAYALRAQILMNAEMYSAAITDYKKVLTLIPVADSTTSIYRVNLSKAYLNTNQYLKAYTILKELYVVDSQNLELLTNLSVCAMKLNNEMEAALYLQRILAINPNYTAGLINFGFFMIEKQEYSKAIEYFNKALSIQPREAYALNNRGYAYYKLGKFENALEDISTSLSYDPSNAYAYRNRAFVYSATGLLKEACSDIQKALQLGYISMYGDDILVLQKEICAEK